MLVLQCWRLVLDWSWSNLGLGGIFTGRCNDTIKTEESSAASVHDSQPTYILVHLFYKWISYFLKIILTTKRDIAVEFTGNIFRLILFCFIFVISNLDNVLISVGGVLTTTQLDVFGLSDDSAKQ